MESLQLASDGSEIFILQYLSISSMWGVYNVLANENVYHCSLLIGTVCDCFLWLLTHGGYISSITTTSNEMWGI